MFRQLLVLEVKGAEERVHTFSCVPNSPLGEVHDALCAMTTYVVSQMQEKAKKNEQEQEKIPEGEAEPENNHNFTPKDVKCKALS